MLGLLTDAPVCPCCVYPFLAGNRGGSIGAGRLWQCAATDAVTVSASGPGTWLTGLNRVDVVDGSILANVSLKMADGRIVELLDGPPARVDAGEQVIVADGKFVVPGYNDMHSHALELADPADALALMLADGVTGFRQMSGSAERLRARREGMLTLGDAAPELLEMPGAVLTPLNADICRRASAPAPRRSWVSGLSSISGRGSPSGRPARATKRRWMRKARRSASRRRRPGRRSCGG